MPTCSVNECEKPSRKRGWCDMHFHRVKAHGDPHIVLRRTSQAAVCVREGCDLKPLARDKCRKHYYADRRPAPSEKPARTPPPCAVAECDNRSNVRGWCGKHYQRWRRFGAPDFHPPEQPRACRIDGCQQTSNARQLCSMHYRRWQVHGDPAVSLRPSQVAVAGQATCSIDDCVNRVLSKGLCVMHYQRAQRNGDPLIRDKVAALKVCATCGVEFDRGLGTARKYCGKRCKPSGRIAGSVNKRSWVEKIGNEDGWHCHLCDSPVDPTLYWPNPRAGSVDHVVPVSYGGTDERINLRLAHVGCNSARKNRLLSD